MAESFEAMVARIKASACFPYGVPIMPKPIKLGKGKEFAFARTKGAAQAKYAWDEWFNPDPKHFPNGLVLLEQSEGKKDEKGNVVEVKVKKDYEVSTDSMPGKIKFAGRKRYKVVEISRRDADGAKLVDSLIIRARDMTPDEKVAEDKLRAEEKVRDDARRKKNAAAAENGAAPAADDDDDQGEADDNFGDDDQQS